MISHFKSANGPERSQVSPKIRQLENGVRMLTENSLAHSPQPPHHPGPPAPLGDVHTAFNKPQSV